MTRNDAEFLKRMRPITWFMVAVGVLIYGAPVVYLNFRDGWYPMPVWRIGVTIWGLGMMFATLHLLRLTFKADRMK